MKAVKVTPDIVAMAKGLGNGFPIEYFGNEKVAACMVPGTHGSTYGMESIGLCGSLETTKHILEPNFLSIIRKKGHFLRKN